MKISENTHRDLTIVSAELTTKDGKRRSFDETIKELISYYRKEE
jgi:hypothetical protein